MFGFDMYDICILELYKVYGIHDKRMIIAHGDVG